MATTIQHKDIADPDRHEPRGASTATSGTIPISNGDGTTTFRKVNFADMGTAPVANGYRQVLSGSSTAASQVPSATNVALQLEFGAAQSTANASLASNGTLTFNTAGDYIVEYNLNVGTTATNALVFVRWLYNTAQTFPSRFARLLQNSTVSYSDAVFIQANAGDVLAIQIDSDAAGAGLGGVYNTAPAASGWTTSPSAFIRVLKLASLS